MDLPPDTRVVGLVRRPTGWFRALVDENHPVLGTPESLLDETKQRQEDLKRRGFCDVAAHNAAWEDTVFERCYRDHLATDAEAEAALEELARAVREGVSVALVCFEGESKRCHRHLLLSELKERID